MAQINQPKCPQCGGMVTQKFQVWQIIVAILFFPWGLIALAVPRKWKCSVCGNWASKEEIYRMTNLSSNNTTNNIANETVAEIVNEAETVVEENEENQPINTTNDEAITDETALDEQLKYAIGTAQPACNTIDEYMASEGVTEGYYSYDAFRQAIAYLLIYLSNINGKTSKKEIAFIDSNLDYNFGLDEISNIKEEIFTTDFQSQIPKIFQLFTKADKEICTAMLKIMKIAGERFLKCDVTTNHNTYPELNDYISNIAEYIENN